MGPDAWDWRLSVNRTGTLPTLKYAVPHLKRQGVTVVVFSSVNGTHTFRSTSATADARAKAG